MGAGRRCLVCIFLVFIYPVVGGMFFLGWRVFYISAKSVSSQCRVKSVDLNRHDDTAEGVWKVTVMDGNERRNGLVKGMLTWNFNKQAWINTENYEVQVIFYF